MDEDAHEAHLPRQPAEGKAREVFHEIIDNVDPKGYPLTVWAVAKAYKQ